MYNYESVANYFLRVDEIVNCMKKLGEEIREAIVVEKFLKSLSPKFESKVSAIEEKENLRILTMSQLHGIITAYEMRKGGPLDRREAAFKASSKGDYYEASHIPEEEEEESNFVRNLQRGSGRFRGKLPFKCFACGRVGHYAAKCPYKDKGKEPARWNKKQGANKKSYYTHEDSDGLSNSDEDEQGDKEKLESYSALEKGKKVSFGNDTPATIKRKGIAQLKEKVKAGNVLYVDGLKHNLLSVSQMCDQRNEVIFRSNGCLVRDLDTGKTVIKGKRTPNNLYIFEEGEQQCYLRKDDEHWLWHRRFVWLGLMKHKDEAFEKFKAFKALAENESRHKIKCLRSDRDGEFTSNEFFYFCEEHGIRREFSTARTPQQNGVVERMNRTIQQMACATLDESGTPATFWG
eukprot:PITA_16986